MGKRHFGSERNLDAGSPPHAGLLECVTDIHFGKVVISNVLENLVRWWVIITDSAEIKVRAFSAIVPDTGDWASVAAVTRDTRMDILRHSLTASGSSLPLHPRSARQLDCRDCHLLTSIQVDNLLRNNRRRGFTNCPLPASQRLGGLLPSLLRRR